MCFITNEEAEERLVGLIRILCMIFVYPIENRTDDIEKKLVNSKLKYLGLKIKGN